jgi:uncharacterized protein (DUF983 family)
MSRKDSPLYNAVQLKCPRCHQGAMFPYSPFSLKFAEMNKTCSHCGLDFIHEPSFYFGAMYISYAVQVAVFVFIYFLLRYTIQPDTSVYIISVIAAVVLILPFNFRFSRAAWLSFFVSYNKTI